MTFPRWQALAALLLVGLGTARIVSTYTVFNHTIDEPDNLAAGMEYLSTGKFLYEDTHPPLARVFGAVGPYLAGERFHPGPNAYFEGYRILGWGMHYDRTLALGRAGILVFFWGACLIVWLWASRAHGPNAALAATLLYTTTPPVLAHAGMITTDMALAATVPAAALASLYWAENPTRRRSVVLGVCTALACISKFSALVFLPAAWASMLVARWLTRHDAAHNRGPRPLAPGPGSLKPLLLAAAACVLAIWAAYAFSFARVEFLHLRLPAPRFFSGIHSVMLHNQRGHPAYLFGRQSPDGFWYYFPSVLAIKTPLAMLILAAAAVVLALRSRAQFPALLPLAFAIGVLASSMRGHIDLGVRYLLPVYAGLAVAAGCAAVEARHLWGKVAVAGLLVGHVASGAWQHPDYLSYTNEIAGSHPERFVADSDLDWGQDMKRLGDFLASQGATSLTFTPFNRTYAWAGHPMPPMSPGDTDHPSPGWNAVSITIWKVFSFPKWADRLPPQQRIGRSILVWRVSPDKISPD